MDIKETRVDTLGKDVIILLLLNLITALDVFLSYFSFLVHDMLWLEIYSRL